MVLEAGRPEFSEATLSEVAAAPAWVKCEQSGRRTLYAKKTALGIVWEVTDGGAANTAIIIGDDLVLLTNTLASLAALLG